VPKPLLAALSALSFAASAIAARFALGGIPHVQDGIAYLLQARIFTHFARVAPTPIDGDLLAREFQILWPEWYAIFPPGWPVVLAGGVAIDLPWIVNPLISATLPWLAWSAFSPHFDARTTRIACGIAALSPGVWTLGASFMSHTLSLALLLLAAAAIGGPLPSVARWARAGAALALLALTRPFDFAVAGGPLLAWGAWRAFRNPAMRPAAGLLIALAAAGPVLLAADNARLTGSPLIFPQDVYFDDSHRPGCNALGFGVDHGCGARNAVAGYTVEMAFGNLRRNARYFDRLFLGFPGGALIALAGLLAVARRSPALAFTAISVPFGYALYWYHGVSYGARFWHAAYLAAIPAAAVSLAWLAGRVRIPRVGGEAIVWLILVAGAAYTYPIVYGELSNNYWCVRSDLEHKLNEAGIESGVVIVNPRGQLRHVWPLTKHRAFRCRPYHAESSGLLHNDPMGGTPITWLRNTNDPERIREIGSNHPGEPIYRFYWNVATGASSIDRWDGTAFESLAGD